MLKPYYFTKRALQVGFNINLNSHKINHSNSILTIEPNFPEIGNDFRYNSKILKEMATLYARIKNHYKFKHQTLFSASFDKTDEVLDETQFFITLKINQNLTESDVDNIDIKSSVEHHIHQQEVKDSRWRFDTINSLTIYFYKLLK